jgi:hypothetical protein
MNKKKILFLLIPIISATILLTGCQTKNTTPVVSSIQETKELTYAGQDGKTVYEILKGTHQVEADESSLGVLVKSIDGVSQTDKEFWLYDINGEQSNLGADKQETKSTDVVHWQLKGF